jgi:hypothetical protein
VRRRAAQLAVAAIAGVALVGPATAQGVVTIGSNLGRGPDGHPGCMGGPCTFALGSVTNPSFAAPNGLTSPVNGTVITWRIRAGASSTATAFRVIRPLGGGLFTGAGTSTTVTPAPDATTPFNTQLLIRIGDLIGIDCCETGFGVYFRDSGGDRLRWNPPLLADGGPGRAPITQDSETLINADIDPTSALANVKARAKKGGKVRVSLEAPNAGSLVAGDKKDASVKAISAAKKPKLLKRTTAQAAAAGPLGIVVKASKAARALLVDGRRPKAKLKLIFTPTGGSASTQVVKVKLKP